MKRILIFFLMIYAFCMAAIQVSAQDTDSDGIPDAEDNCPFTANGPSLGTCTVIYFGKVMGTGDNCTDNSMCSEGETCQMEQGDCNGNSIGDVCECYADFDNDTQVGLFDLITMKSEFGRFDCNETGCETDCSGDGKVSLQDEVILRFEIGKKGCPN